VSVGLVRFVFAELPHAAANAAARNSSAAGARHFTLLRECTTAARLVQFPRSRYRFALTHVVFRLRRTIFLFSVVALLTGCAGGYTLARVDSPSAGVDASLAGPIAWYSPAVSGDRAALARWRGGVGPPVVRRAMSPVISRADEITIASWNTALGSGDIVGFVRELHGAAPERPVVLLLQEVYRRGAIVPRALALDAAFAGRLGGSTGAGVATDIEAVAAQLGMTVYYVPSMRNGGGDSDEDRGNAILSNLRIEHLEAIELPFERQRRVAVAAEIQGTTTDGHPWRLRVVSAHLDNTIARRWWIGSEYGRARQARGLVALLDGDVPTVLGGDFNTWFGFSDQAYVETARSFPQTPTTDDRATFLGVLRLDHLFYRLPAGWQARARRGESRYGSDHSPLIGSVRFR
jgi:endonuclease/exonuclease/phosphatase family metal-dependent hydrolase